MKLSNTSNKSCREKLDVSNSKGEILFPSKFDYDRWRRNNTVPFDILKNKQESEFKVKMIILNRKCVLYKVL